MNTNLHILKRSFGLIKGHKIKLFLGICLSFVSSFFGIGSGYTLKFLIDEVLLNKRVQWLWPIQFVFIGFVLADCFFDVLKTAIFNSVAAVSLKKIRITLFKKILNLKYTVIKKLNIANTINQIQYGVDSISGILGGGILIRYHKSADLKTRKIKKGEIWSSTIKNLRNRHCYCRMR